MNFKRGKKILTILIFRCSNNYASFSRKRCFLIWHLKMNVREDSLESAIEHQSFQLTNTV